MSKEPQQSKSERWVVEQSLPDSLWKQSEAGRRSDELTPLYVIRQKSPFSGRGPTYHDHWEVLVARSGTGELAGADSVPLRANTVCLIPPGTTHRETSDDVMDIIWIGLRGRRLSDLEGRGIRVAVTRDVSDLMERMWMCVQMTAGGIGPELDAMAALILSRFLRLQGKGEAGETDRVERAITIFHERMSEALPLPDIARELRCSVSCLSREFRRRTGLTPVSYLTGVRVKHAARLLETTDLRLGEIAQLTGYGDPFYLSRVFKRVMGRSPALWRTAQAEERRRATRRRRA